jgi:copper homeostasis protein
MQVEICANGLESAIIAQKAGADRIELCKDLSVGGLSPSPQLIDSVMELVDIPVHVLIRPRAGDFCYSDAEFEHIIDQVMYCKERGCAGVVCGLLTQTGELDQGRLFTLLEYTQPLDFTFHRAVDVSSNPHKLVGQLVETGVERVLSSGQQPTAVRGLALLKELKQAFGNEIEIMPGGGIDQHNALLFKNEGFSAIHLSATKKVDQRLNDLFTNRVEGHSDYAVIKKVVAVARSAF